MTNSDYEMHAWMLMGQAMDAVAKYGDFERAIGLFTQALQYAPNNGEIYHNRGMAYSHLERWREALADFNRAVALSPHSSSYEQRAVVYVRMGNRQAARQDWEQALRLDSRRTNALMNLGWLCVEERRIREALDYFSKAIAIEPTLAVAFANRAKLYMETGDRTRAFADLQSAKDLVDSGRDTSDQDLRD